MPSKNTTIRHQIKELYSQRIGHSYESLEYKRITREIEILSLQIESEHHWSATPGFWVSFVAMIAACIAAYPIVFEYVNKQIVQEQQTDIPHNKKGARSGSAKNRGQYT